MDRSLEVFIIAMFVLLALFIGVSVNMCHRIEEVPANVRIIQLPTTDECMELNTYPTTESARGYARMMRDE